MSFEKKARQIRNGIKRYTTHSMVNLLLGRLHAKYDDGTIGMPWVVCLTLDWVLELEPNKGAIDATEQDVQKILDKMWRLQSDASKISTTENIWLTMRSFFLPQLRFQIDQIHHSFFLVRLYTLMCSDSASSSFKTNFKAQVGIDLQDFFVFSLFLCSLFMNQNTAYIPYKELIAKLHPAFSMETIKLMLKTVGVNALEMRELAQERRKKLGDVKPSEYFLEPMLLSNPLILLPSGISTAHTYVATIGISEFVIRTLKRADPGGFRDKFAKEFENYLALLFEETGFKAVRESQLNDFYKLHKKQGKVVDFLYQSNGTSIFVDAKGVEPRQDVLTTDNSGFLKDKLKSLHLKGIQQAGKCSEILESCNYENLAEYQNRYALIVTHQDFYLGGGVKLASYLGEDHKHKVESAIEGQIPLENVHFCSVADFEGILALCSDTGADLHEFLDYCADEENSPETAKFEMRQHIQSFGEHKMAERPSPIGSDRVVSNAKQLYADLEERMDISRKHWNEGLERAPEFLMKLNSLQVIAS
ncbi:hypothetical protein C942_04664 [Photobacterium marinum]|uniref:Uncharacterized protein n=1 Tax=Photobacterium marinum TaxID=1056511 RepID=L8JDR3_9GAMM|nr:hypothetical protein [Photobacterium marinum]ELR66960.1 hypothetical protein C942_04664 [Photobacterium marinum]